MKRKILSLALLFIIWNFSSCKSSSSFENDVRKMAALNCRAQQLMAKGRGDEKAKQDLAELRKEMDAYSEKMVEKYKDKKDDKEMDTKAQSIMMEVMNKCK